MLSSLLFGAAACVYLEKVHGRLLCRLRLCFYCSAEGLVTITTRTTTLAYRYELVTESKNWEDAHAYCQDQLRSKLLVIKNDVDALAVQAYLDKVHSEFARRLAFQPLFVYKSSAVAEMGDRGHNRYGPITGGRGCYAPFAEAETPPNTMWPGPTKAHLFAKCHLDPSGRFTTIDMGRKLGAPPPFWEGAGSPSI